MFALVLAIGNVSYDNTAKIFCDWQDLIVYYFHKVLLHPTSLHRFGRCTREHRIWARPSLPSRCGYSKCWVNCWSTLVKLIKRRSSFKGRDKRSTFGDTKIKGQKNQGLRPRGIGNCCSNRATSGRILAVPLEQNSSPRTKQGYLRDYYKWT